MISYSPAVEINFSRRGLLRRGVLNLATEDYCVEGFYNVFAD